MVLSDENVAEIGRDKNAGREVGVFENSEAIASTVARECGFVLLCFRHSCWKIRRFFRKGNRNRWQNIGIPDAQR
jgi:hypothetical protein